MAARLIAMTYEEAPKTPGNHDGWGVLYGGQTSGARDEKVDAGIGLYKSEHFDLVNATGEFGAFAPEEGAGVQFGAKGEANSIGMKGSLGDLFGLIPGVSTTDEKQGGWENFVSGEVHGPRAAAEAHIGTDGFAIGAGAELGGGSVKIGGAEYDGILGTECTIGAGAGGGGANFGLNWSDDDQDGLHEFGLSLGGELGIGVDVGMKTEALGHAYNSMMQGWEYLSE